jgi:RNA polymerase sigma-70 factor (ECF subfamily)
MLTERPTSRCVGPGTIATRGGRRERGGALRTAKQILCTAAADRHSPMNVESLQSQWLQQAVAGDTAALKLLLADIRPRVARHVAWRIPAGMTGAKDVDDVLQDAYLEVFSRIASFQPRTVEGFYRWVATIAMNRLRDAIRRHRALKRGGIKRPPAATQRGAWDSSIALLDLVAGPERTPSRVLARSERVAAVQAALASLPEHYRQAVALVYLDGRTVGQAAEIMKRSERAVHGLCRRSLRLLSEELERGSVFLSSCS